MPGFPGVLYRWVCSPTFFQKGIFMADFPSGSFTVRTMTADDLAKIVELERRCHITPWSAKLFEEELSRAYSTIDILWQADRLVGYICFWQVCDELHILNVAVDRAFRRRGLGRVLVEHVLQHGRAGGCDRAFLEVRTGNRGAIALYESLGFEVIGRRVKYYPDGEDALVMERKILHG